jgi:hypothetical protein
MSLHGYLFLRKKSFLLGRTHQNHRKATQLKWMTFSGDGAFRSTCQKITWGARVCVCVCVCVCVFPHMRENMQKGTLIHCW